MIKLKLSKDGLVPAVVQDHKTKEVLMVAYMNALALKRTLKTGKAWFYSRSRNKMWLKGEQSGNIQKVKKVYVDCDNDCILLEIIQVGGASCHTGYRSCFYRQLNGSGKTRLTQKRVFDPAQVYKK